MTYCSCLHEVQRLHEGSEQVKNYNSMEQMLPEPRYSVCLTQVRGLGSFLKGGEVWAEL